MRLPIILVILLVACDSGSPKTSVDQHAAAEAVGANDLTMAKYQRLETGMSYAQVVEILGVEGSEMSSNEIGGTRTVMYMWEGSGGANMNAMFQNDKLIQKSQFGLQ